MCEKILLNKNFQKEYKISKKNSYFFETSKILSNENTETTS